MGRSEHEVFEELSRIAASPGFAHLVAFFCIRDNFVWYRDDITADDLQHLYSRSRLIRTEIFTLVGLMLQGSGDYTGPPPTDAAALSARTEALLEELHGCIGRPNLAPGEAPSLETWQAWWGSGEAMREPIFYGGEAAFSIQNCDFAISKYAADREWLIDNRGVAIDDMVAVAKAIGNLQFGKATTAYRMRVPEPGADHLLEAFRFRIDELQAYLPLPSDRIAAAVEAFASPLGERNATFEAVGDYNAANGSPILKLSSGDYLLFHFNALAEALYESPFYWMIADAAYRDTAFEHRGAFTEEFALDRLTAVFGARAYRGIHLERKKGERLGEIDILVPFGNRAVVVQAKSKRLTLEARRGNEIQLKKDFRDAVQHAYDQAIECSVAVQDREVHLVQADGSPLILETPLRTLYPLCLVADHYPALAFQTRQFLKREEPEGVRAPLVMDLFALDSMAEFLDRPLRFLSYLDLRALSADRLHMSHEITLLSFHLKYNLWLTDEFDSVMLEDDFAADTEIAINARRLGMPGKRTPEGILTAFAGRLLDRIIETIEAEPTPPMIDLVLLLYQLGGAAMTDLAGALEHIVAAAVRRGQSDFSIAFAGTGLTVHCNAAPDSEAQQVLEQHILVKKHATRSTRWFGMTLAPGSGALRFAKLVEFPWRPDRTAARAARALGGMSGSRSLRRCLRARPDVTRFVRAVAGKNTNTATGGVSRIARRSPRGRMEKPMGRKRKSGKKGQQPDEIFAHGPLVFARFGQTTVAQSRMDAKEFNAMQQHMAASLPEVVREIDELVAKIAGQIAGLPAGRLLHRAHWEFAALAMTQGPQAVEEAGAIRMLDYVQSVVAAVPPHPDVALDVSEEDWQELKGDIMRLFQTISLKYHVAQTAARRLANPDLDMALEEFRVRAEGMWMHVRGKRYQEHEVIALGELLAPQSALLERLFGISAPALAAELGKILAKLTGGAGAAMLAMKKLHEDSIPIMSAIIDEGEANSMEEVGRKLFADPELAARRDRITGEIAGLDLFDVVKVSDLPLALIDALTWNPGEDEEFFAPGEFAGWPLRIWPTMKRPFIRIEGRAMCFDMWGLFDNIYRAIQRLVFAHDPASKPIWNQGQKEVSEELPLHYLGRILPGALSYAPVYYKWKDSKGKTGWHECDGLLLYDDHLFVVEVKAGAFTYTSPSNDLEAHLASLQNLVASPASQGSRFLDYLDSADEVTLFNEDHEEIERIRAADYRHKTILALSLDAFTELAARAVQLREVGVDIGARNVWALSIDDLRVYADMFANPLAFLHFTEQRMAAARNRRVVLDDELDHAGLYLVQNNYGQFADEIGGNAGDMFQFTGYRTPIDEFYAGRAYGEDPPPPAQEMPARLREIIDFLAASQKPGRAFLASFLLDGGGDLRSTIDESIANQLAGNKALRRQRPVLIGADSPLVILTWSPPIRRDAEEALNYARSVVAGYDEAGRLLVELEFDAADRLVDVHWQQVSLGGLSDAEIAAAKARGRAGNRRRVVQARQGGKIPVNSQCPCGSGKKYKRCCRP